MTELLAIVLAGGRGSRMDILCQVRPKPTLPFGGISRVIDFSLSNCLHSNINDVAILTDYQRIKMADYLERWREANADSIGFDILEPRKILYKGTADAVYQNLDYLKAQEAENVLILAGDHIYKMDYRNMLAFHQRMRADVTVGISTIPIDEAYRFGTVRIDPTSRITDFVEKSRHPVSILAGSHPVVDIDAGKVSGQGRRVKTGLGPFVAVSEVKQEFFGQVQVIREIKGAA